jgi:predicted acylesterase/phospholipase RssA
MFAPRAASATTICLSVSLQRVAGGNGTYESSSVWRMRNHPTRSNIHVSMRMLELSPINNELRFVAQVTRHIFGLGGRGSMTDEKKGRATFNIGIAMAGAVSGGAYSAGVFDFLMEALNEWQKHKNDPGANVPRHDVFISAVSGTSAGGITAALGLASLADGIRSVEEPSVDPHRWA